MAVVHQLLLRFRRGEPATESAIRLSALLRRLGHWGELAALEPPRSEAPWVRSLGSLRLRRTDWVLGHHAGASALTARLLLLGCRRGLVLDVLPSADPGSRAQLAGLASRVELALAPSTAAARALERAGHRNVMRFTPHVEADRFGQDRAPHGRPRLAPGRPVVVCDAGSLAPRRPEEVLAFHRELLRLRPDAQLLLLGRLHALQGVRPFVRQAVRLRGLRFLGQRAHDERVAVLRGAQLFLSLAENDASGESLLEAMAADLPVLAFATGAVPEALDGAGVGFTEKRFAFLAELAVQLSESPALRERVVEGQRRRLGAFSAERAEKSLRVALATLAGPTLPRRRRRRPRVAVLVQRYGDVTGGAEALARSIVRRMSRHWEVTVLTTCATDHLTWGNTLPAGSSSVDGARVVRFPVRFQREMPVLNALSRRLFGRSLDRGEEERWVALQGPLVPGLWRHLSEEGGRYDGFVAFTYLYALTAWAVPMVGARTLLVPTAHDEPPLAFECYREVFERPRGLLVSTPEELGLVRRRFPHHARARVVGAGVERRPGDPRRFRRRHRVDRPYLLYVGRVEAGKGIPELLAFHRALWASEREPPALVLAGHASLRAEGPGVHALGRISEQDKWDALAGATAVVVPSPLESLSLLALEAFAAGVPVIGNAHSDVVRGQLRRSGAGRVYSDAATFREAVQAVIARRAPLARKGRAFAAKHRWSNVVQAYRQEMKRIVEEP